jgi:hypothetical protein
MSDSKVGGSAANIVIQNITKIEEEIERMKSTGQNRSDALANQKIGLYLCKLETPEYEEFRKEAGVHHAIPDHRDYVAIELVEWTEEKKEA